MSSLKSSFLLEEHAWEAMMSRRVAKLERQLEFAHHESQDQTVEATEAQVVELLTAEWATAAEQGLEVVKVHQEEAEEAL